MGLYAGAAEDYDKYRQKAPQELIDFIVEHTPDPRDTFLDLGTGTGAILEQFMPYFDNAIALEPDEGMIASAQQRLKGQSVTFLHQPAETLSLTENKSIALVTICRAFHWMDGEAVLRKLDHLVEQTGVVAIFGSRSIWRLDDEISNLTRSVVQEFLGTDRQTVEGTFTQPKVSFVETLARSAFSDIIERQFPIQYKFGLEDFIGYMHSNSFASRALLGDRVGDFDSRLIDVLTPYIIDGKITQDNEFNLLLARRP